MLTLKEISAPADFEIFKTLLLEYAARDLSNVQNSTIWKDIEQLPGRYAAPLGSVVLGYANEVLAGCGAIVPSAHQGIAEIKRVYVRDGFRRRGMARALTQVLTSRARQAGYHTAAICTWPHNTQALALYQQQGFMPIAPFRDLTHAQFIFLGLPLGQTVQDKNSTTA